MHKDFCRQATLATLNENISSETHLPFFVVAGRKFLLVGPGLLCEATFTDSEIKDVTQASIGVTAEAGRLAVFAQGAIASSADGAAGVAGATTEVTIAELVSTAGVSAGAGVGKSL